VSLSTLVYPLENFHYPLRSCLQYWNISIIFVYSDSADFIIISRTGKLLSILFWIRPSTLGGSTGYGLAQLEEKVELAQIISLTDDKGQNATSQNMPARIKERTLRIS